MSQIFMPLDQDQIPEEIQQLAGQLIIKIGYLYPGLKIEVDDRNINYSTKVDMDILSQCLLEIGALPEIKEPPEESYTPLEKNILDGIRTAKDDNRKMEVPPVHPIEEASLALYYDALTNNKYTTTSVMFEIGRLITIMTYGLSQRSQNAEAQNLFKKNISTINYRPRALMAIRLYQYFQNDKQLLLYNGVDRVLKPLTVGKISQKTSENLKRKIYTTFIR